MRRITIKCIFAIFLSICLLLTQSFGMVYATGNTKEESSVSEEHVSGYRETEPIDSSFAKVKSQYGRVNSVNLPTSYSSSKDAPMEVEKRENVVTSVKSQNPYGTCWAHSAISLAESSYIINEGISPDSVDYNEYHLVHYGYGEAADSLNLFGGDYNTAGNIGNILNAGGNNIISLCMFASWQGASDALETEFGAENIENGNLPESILGYDDAAHMENGYILTMPDMTSSNYKADMDIVKQMIMDYGSVSISYYSNHDTAHFRECFQYYDQEHVEDHAVTIVGWNDTVSKSSFAIEPPGDGAWIVKNSWSKDWGYEGYFYLSYYDVTIGENAFAFDFVSGDNYDNNYQYDGGGSIYGTTMGYYGQVTAANAFVADSNETLEAVGFYTNQINTNYEIRIYRKLDACANPNTGTLVLTQTGTQTYVGYHTVELDAKIPIEEGERYAIVITFTGAENEYFSFPVDKTDDFGWVEFYSRAKAYESYAGSSVTSLKDLNPSNTDDYYDGKNARIKAFTNEAEGNDASKVTEVQLDITTCNIDKGQSLKLTATVLPADASNAKLVWSSSDEGVATVDQYGNVYGVSGGVATITATAQDGSGESASCQVSVKEVFAEGLEIGVGGEVISYYRIPTVGSTVGFQAIFSPADTTNTNVTWSSSNPSVLTVDANGRAKGLRQGYALLTATTQDGTEISKTCMVAVERVLLDTMTICSGDVELEQLTTSEIGRKLSLDAVIQPVEAEIYDVIWESSNPEVAMVDEYGVVTTKSIGETVITASITLDYTYTEECYLYVVEEERPVESLDITLNGTLVDNVVAYERGDYFVFGTNILPGNATNKTLKWYSSNEEVARIFGDGMVSVNSYGTATIYAMATDGSGVQDSVTIVVKSKTYTITFDGNGATSGSMSQLNCGYGIDYRLPRNTFVRKNHKFTGWNTSEDGTGAAYTDEDVVWNLCEEDGGNITLYAQWIHSDLEEPEYPDKPEGPGNQDEPESIPIPMQPYQIDNLSTGVCVYWEETEEATQYSVWRSDNGKNGTYQCIATTSSLDYVDKSVQSGKTYYYKIAVYDTVRKVHGEKSEDIGIMFLTAPKVSSKENVTDGIKLKWGKIIGAKGYVIYRKNDSSDDEWKKIATLASGSKVSYTDKSIKKKNGYRYRYRVQALNGTTKSGYKSDTLMVRLTTQKIKIAKKSGSNSLRCTWATNTKVTGYEVRLMIGSKVYKNYKVKKAKTSSKTIKKLPKGKKYKIQIRTYKTIKDAGVFYSAWSAAKTVTIKK